MSKKVKNLIAGELETKFKGSDSIVVVDYTGIDASTTNAIRGALRTKQAKMTVVRNAMAAKALAAIGFGEAKNLLSGTNAVAYGGESIVDLVKELVEQAKKVEKFKIKGSIVEGKLLDAAATTALSKLPNKKELQGIIAGQLVGPGRKLAGQLVGPGRKLAGQVKAVIEKAEKAAPAAPTEPAPAAA